MKKILFYINTLGLDGAERVVANLCNQFSQDGFNVYLVTSFPKAKEYQTNPSVNRYYLEKKEIVTNFLKRNYTRTKKLRNIIKTIKPDVVVSFMAEPNFRAITACLGLAIPVVISVRNTPDKEYSGKMNYFAQKILFPFARGYVFQTKDAQEWFPSRIQQKSTIILNQVDPAFFDTKRTSQDYYVAIGRLTKQKNYPMMISGFKRFVDDNPQEQLYIYSDGEEKETLQKMIQKYSLKKNIRLMGRSESIAEVLSHAKAFIMTSDYEGMPNVMLEAMAVGLPIIVTDCPCGGPRMVIKNGQNGMLIPTNDPPALCSALNKINSDGLFRERLSNEAKKSAEQFKPEIIYQQWKEYILSLIRD